MKEESHLMEKYPMIFVFGSNLAGRHGKGAALHARLIHGAIYGVGKGRTGNAYAIPTKDERLRTLSLSRIKGSCRPKIYYEEHREIVEELEKKSLILSQKLCYAITGFNCILLEERREYCYDCPDIKECPYEYKSLPK